MNLDTPYYVSVKPNFLLTLLLMTVAAALAQQSDPWPAAAIIPAAQLAKQIKANPSTHVIYVGFPILYKGAHIAKAAFAGPCSKPEGVGTLVESVKSLPHETEVVIYCGCCPFARCPNIRPAYRALKDAGFTNIRVVQLDTNLHTDGVEKGYPTETK